MSVYLTNFSSLEDIANAYAGDKYPYEFILADLAEAKILVAWYGYGSYEGASFVLYEKNGQLFEVNASHCSCYGLEDQWTPEETSWQALSYILEKGTKFSDYYDGFAEVNSAIVSLVKENYRPELIN